MNLIDPELRALAEALARALLADSSPYSAPDRIAGTAALMRGDYRDALSLIGHRPHAAPRGPEPAADVLAWWYMANALACRLEDYAIEHGQDPRFASLKPE